LIEKPIIVLLTKLTSRVGPTRSRTTDPLDDDRPFARPDFDLVCQPRFFEKELRETNSSRISDLNQLASHHSRK